MKYRKSFLIILTQIHIKGTIVSLRNMKLTVCYVETQIVTKQFIFKYLLFNLLRSSWMYFIYIICKNISYFFGRAESKAIFYQYKPEGLSLL